MMDTYINYRRKWSKIDLFFIFYPPVLLFTFQLATGIEHFSSMETFIYWHLIGQHCLSSSG